MGVNKSFVVDIFKEIINDERPRCTASNNNKDDDDVKAFVDAGKPFSSGEKFAVSLSNLVEPASRDKVKMIMMKISS